MAKLMGKRRARSGGERCGACGAPKTKKDVACLRCAANETAQRRVEVIDVGDHECAEPRCERRISNRYKLPLCAAHSLKGAREERERIAQQADATHARRVEQGKQLAARMRELAKEGRLTHFLDGSPIRGRMRLHVEAQLAAGRSPSEVRTEVEQMRKDAAESESAPSTDATDITATTEDTMSAKKKEKGRGAKAAAPRSAKREASADRKAEPSKSHAGNVKVTDEVVVAHVAKLVKADPEVSMGATLKALHADGKACNPVRFKVLFLKVKNEK